MQTFVLHTGGNAGNAGGFAGGVIEHAGKTYRGPWPILAPMYGTIFFEVCLNLEGCLVSG